MTGTVNTDIIIRIVGAIHADLIAHLRSQLGAESGVNHTFTRRTGGRRPDPDCIRACGTIGDIMFNFIFWVAIMD
jgi:hypothetical protein